MAGMAANITVSAKKANFLVFNELKDHLTKVSSQSSRTAQELKKINTAITTIAGLSIGGAGLAELYFEVIRVGNAVDGLQSSFTATFGSQQVSAEMDYIRGVANDLGLEMLSLGDSYAKWAAAAKGTVLEGQAQKDIFESVAQASRVLNLSVDDTEGTLRALSQMISKGKVQAEELRGQLGERLPGAFAMAAKAMGVTTAELDKMLQDGKVLAADLLPKLAVELDNAYGGEARAKAVQSLAAETNRLRNSLTELSLEIYKAIEPQLAEWAKTGAEAADYLAKNLHLLEGAVVAVAALMVGNFVASMAEATAASIKSAQAAAKDAEASTQAAAKKAAAAEKAKAAEAKKAQAALQSAQATKTAAQAEVKAAQASVQASIRTNEYKVALERLKAAQKNSVAASATLSKARKNEAIATQAAAESTKIAAGKKTAAIAATQKMGVVAKTASLAMKGLSAAMALVGGPIGLVITAMSALIYYFDDLKAYAESSGIADRFALEFEHMADSWSSVFDSMPNEAQQAGEQSAQALSQSMAQGDIWQTLAIHAQQSWLYIAQGFIELGDNIRKGLTYLPQIVQAIVVAMQAHFQAWVLAVQADLERLSATFNTAGAAIIDIMGGVFAGIATASGKAMEFILTGIANVVDGFSLLSYIPGFESIGESAQQTAKNLQGMAKAAGESGQHIKASLQATSASMRESAAESTVTAEKYDAYSAGARRASQAIFENTGKLISNAEQQRQLSLEMLEAEQQFAALEQQGQRNKAGTDQQTDSTKQLVNSLNQTGEAAGSAAKGKQKLTEAQKAAKKAAEELASAQQKITDQFTAAEQKQAVLNETLKHGEAAGRQLELRYQSMHKGVMLLSESQAAELQQLEAGNQAIEEQIKQREAAAQAIDKAKEAVADSAQALAIAGEALHLNDEQLRALTLSYEDGYTQALAEAQAKSEAQTKALQELRTAQINAREAVGNSEKALSLAQQALGKTDQQVRALELSFTRGYTPAMAKAQAAAEANTQATEALRSAQQTAQKALEDTAKQLNLAEKALSLNDQQVRELELSLTKGYTPAQAKAQAADEQRIKTLQDLRTAQINARKTVEDSEKALSLAQQALGKTDQQVRELELSLTKGYTPAMAEAQAAAEAKTKATETLRAAQQSVQKALDETAQKLNMAEKALHLTDQGVRELELSLTQGYTPAQAKAQAADEKRIQSLQDLRTAQINAREAVEESEKALELAQKAMGLNDEQLRALTLSYEKGYTPAQAKAQAANEAQTKSLQTVRSGLQDLQTAQQLHTISMTQGGAAAEIAKLKMEGYSQSQAENKVVTEENMKFQQEFYDTLVDSIKNAESVKDVFKGIGDFLKNWLKDQITHFAANKIMAFVGINGPSGGGLNIGSLLGGGGSSGGGSLLGNLLGSGGSGGSSFLSGITSGIGSVFSGIGSTISSGFTSIMGSLGGVGSAISGAVSGIGSALGGLGGVMGALGPVGLIGAAVPLISSLFGGKPQKIKGRFGQFADVVQDTRFVGDQRRDERVFYQTARSDREFHRTSAFGQFGVLSGPSQSIGRDSDDQIPAIHAALDAMKALDDAFVSLLPSTQEGTAQIERTAQALDGFNMNALNTQDLLRKRTVAIYNSMATGVKEALNGINGSFKGLQAEELAQRLELLAQVSQTVQPTIEALGLKISDTWDKALRDSVLLTETLGGTQAAMQQLGFYAEHFTPEGQLAAQALESARASLSEWNNTLGLSGETAIDTKAELYNYVQNLNLSTQAGRDAAAAAFAQMEALLAVAQANEQAKVHFDAVSDAARNLNLNFDATSPAASGAASALIELMGGLDAFTSATQNYYQQFYSQEEQQQLALANAASAVSAFNDSLGLTGQAAIDTAEEFRSYVESLDLTTEEGRQAYATALELADSMAAVADSGLSLNELIDSLPKNLQGAFELMSAGSLSTADTLEASAEAVQTAAGEIGSATLLAGEDLQGLGVSITQVADSAAGAADTAASAAEQAAQATQQAAQAAAQAVNAAQSASAAAGQAGAAASAAAGAANQAQASASRAGTSGETLPAFARGGITSGPSLAGEAGPEAVIPLPDGRTVPVSLDISGLAEAFRAVATQTTDSTDYRRLQDAIQYFEQQHGRERKGWGMERKRELRAMGWSQPAARSQWRREKHTYQQQQRDRSSFVDTAVYADYQTQLSELHSQFEALSSATAESTQGVDRQALAQQGWNQAMIDSLSQAQHALQVAEQQAEAQKQVQAAMQAANDALFELEHGSEALRERQLLEQGWSKAQIEAVLAQEAALAALQQRRELEQQQAEQQAHINTAYQEALQAARDHAYELKQGSEALRIRTLREQGWSQAQVDEVLALEKANQAEHTRLEQLAEEQQRLADINQAFRDTLQSEADRRFALLHGQDALEREQRLREGWTLSMVNSVNAQRAANDELERQISVWEQLQGVAVNLREAANDLRFDGNLGLATPAEQLAQARLDVDQLAQSALTDPAAAEALADAVQHALSLSREYHASSAAYVADFERYTALLANTADQLEDQERPGSNGVVVNENVLDARPVFQAQQQNTEQQREIKALRDENTELKKQIVDLLREIRDDQRDIGTDAYEQREQQNQHQQATRDEVKQLRTEQRERARFQEVA